LRKPKEYGKRENCEKYFVFAGSAAGVLIFAMTKTIKLLNEDSKNVPLQKKSGQLCRFCPVMPELSR